MGHTPYHSDKHGRSTGMEQYLILFFTRYACRHIPGYMKILFYACRHILRLYEEARTFIAVVRPCSICGDCNR